MKKLIPIIGLLLLPLIGMADTPPPNTVKAKTYSGDGVTPITATSGSLNVNVTNSGGTSTVNQGNAGSQSWLVNVTNTVPVSGTLTCNAGSGTLLVDGSAHTQPVSGTFWQATQPVSGTLTCNAGSGTLAVSGPLTDTQLRASPVPVSGSITTTNSANGNTGSAVPSQATQVGGSDGTNLRAIKVSSAGVVSVDGSATIQPISAASLPLPTGASTAAGLTTINSTLGSPFQAGGSIGNSSFGATQSGTWNTGRTWTLLNSTDSVNAVQSGSWSVTANAGTNLNTSLLALEGGGNLASINTKTPALGQALAAASVPVVLTASQLTTLTPLSTIAATQSGSWTTGRTWNLSSASDSVSVSNFPSGFSVTQGTSPWVVSGTVTSNIGTTNGLALDSSVTGLQVAQGSTTSGEKGGLTLGAVTTAAPSYTTAQTSPLSLTTAGALRTDSSASTQPISGSVTANAGTNLNTSLLALESGGNLASINSKVPSLGQALAAASVPVVLTASQLSTLTPLSTVTVTQGTGTNLHTVVDSGSVTTTNLDALPAPINVTTQDLASSSTAGANGQNFITGTPTANSAASFALSSYDAIEVQVTGTWTGTVVNEVSMDGGTTWFTRGIKQTGSSYLGSSYTANFEGGMNFAGMTNVRVRATAAMTGTAIVRVTASVNPASLVISNPLTLRDATVQSTANTIKAASTAAGAADTALVVAVSPNNSVAVTNSSLTSIDTKTPALGQTTKSASQPVTMASDQTPMSYISTSGTITTQNLNPNNGVATAGSSVELALSSTGAATIQTVGTYSGALSVQGTVDGVQWIGAALTIFNIASGAAASTIPSAQNSIYITPAIGYTKIRVTALAAVTGSVVVTINASPADSIFKFIANSSISTTNQITNGQTVNSTASTGGPVRIGGRIITTPDTTYVQGDAADTAITTGQQLMTKEFATSENDWQASSGLTPLATTTSTALKAAGAANIRNFVTAIQLFNTSATVSTTVTILDGASVLWTGYLPATTAALPVVPIVVHFPTPLRGSTATAMNIQLGTTLASVYYNVQGYISF